MTSTIDLKEVEKFSSIADEWWSQTGKFKPLHKFNPIRISYIREEIIKHFDLNKDSLTPFELYKKNNSPLEILDVGCGGGLISEPFAQMKAAVTGIDASEKNIQVAKIHAEKSALKINYQAISSEELVKEDKKYDVVLALEIIEHVANVEAFIKSCSELVKENGLLFVATLNRTSKSLLLAKFAAEYILRWVPAGTHDWKKFLKPSEINSHATRHNLDLLKMSGFSYNLLKDEWKADANDLDVNYIMVFAKK
jgi:2-polyprenyl-6-hydroxyphenyl methylase / 3-demethylubiquinone-9 3-methyltransferase